MSPIDDPNIRALATVLGEPSWTESSDEVRFSSPFREKFKDPHREDKKKHLYVNPRKGKFQCFKSGVGGSIGYLLRLLGLDSAEAPITQEDFQSLRERVLKLGSASSLSELPVADLPEWAVPVEAGSEVHRYLHSRGVSEGDIQYYRLHEGTGDHVGWVVVPSYVGGRCEYWVSRSTRRKIYMNPEVDRRRHVVFLEQALENSSPLGSVIVCEGVFSALAAGRDAVATLGKLVTEAQLRRMWDAGVRQVTLALDDDAWRESLDTAERCLRIGYDVSIVPLPTGQDPSDMGREAFRSLLGDASLRVTKTSLISLRLNTM
jgi:DNA primase